MRNAPFYALVGVVSIIVGLLALGIFLQTAQGALPENAASGICAVAFLGAAIVLYELITKPSLYGRRRKERETEDDREEEEGRDEST